MRKLGIIAGILMASHGCAPLPRTAPLQPEIVINFERGTVSSPEWQTQLIDCSDSRFHCIEAPGHFLMAFPRVCANDSWDWNVAGYRFQLTAPMEHYGLPSGGYFSEKYPHAYLLYQRGRGFFALWMRTNPVPTENWGGASTAEYRIRYVGNEQPFACQ